MLITVGLDFVERSRFSPLLAVKRGRCLSLFGLDRSEKGRYSPLQDQRAVKRGRCSSQLGLDGSDNG